MNNGIYTSGLGAVAQDTRIGVISNNLANINTPAFRRDQLAFQERLVEALEDQPDFNYYNALVDRYGGAPYIESIKWDREAGGYNQTGRPLDVAIQGDGFFVVRETGTDNVFHTRAGNFIFNNKGNLVTADGRYEVLNDSGRPIRMREGLPTEFVIDPNGTVYQAGEALDTLGIDDFEDYDHLVKHGSMLYKDDGSAGIRNGTPERINQGFLETSSANPLTEMVEMIKAMRILESNLQMIKIQDGSLDRLINDFGRLAR